MAVLALAAVFAECPPTHAAGAVSPWNPLGISSPQWESHPAFDPVTGDFYFVRSTPAFEGWQLLVSRCTPAGWSTPEPPAFASDAIEADPYFAQGNDLDIWRVDRPPGGAWGTPVRLPEPVNSDATEWFPRLAPDGSLYFGSKRAGGHGGNDIWRARRDAAGRWLVENLGPAINTEGDEYEPLLSRDGSRLVVATADGFFESRMTPRGWSARNRLGTDINANGTEIGPLFSPGERALLFSRDTRGPDSGEFFVWREDDTEAWPPDCPGR